MLHFSKSKNLKMPKLFITAETAICESNMTLKQGIAEKKVILRKIGILH
jgi:hypothetical protein